MPLKTPCYFFWPARGTPATLSMMSNGRYTECVPTPERSAVAIARFCWSDSRARSMRILPDACDYLLHRENEGFFLLSGNRRAFQTLEVPAGRIDGWKLQPGTAAALLGVDARDLPGDGVIAPLREVSGLTENRLETLRRLEGETGAGRLDAAFALEGVLSELLRFAALSPSRKQRLIPYIASRLAKTESLGHLANECGVSIRTLERRCREYCGLNPTELRSIMRFFGAYLVLRSGTPGDSTTSLTHIAHASGYADQAHFIRDFRRFSGLRPGEIRRRPERHHLDFSAPGT